jgi:hypothetical protein
VEDSKFEEFWRAYPRRDGPNPRKPAEQKFNALAKTGVDPDVMIQAAKSLAIEESRRGKDRDAVCCAGDHMAQPAALERSRRDGIHG